jgi:hypothetical protein
VKTVLNRKVDPFKDAEKVGTERPVMTVWGRADSVSQESFTMSNGRTSHFPKFRGEFEVHEGPPPMKAGDKTHAESSVVILPDVAADVLAGIMRRPGSGSTNFSFLIGVKKSDIEGGMGYEYTCVPLFDVKTGGNPLTAVYANALKHLPAKARRKTTGNGGKKKGNGKPATPAAAAPAGK